MKKLNNKGQALVEYVLIIAMISVVVIGIVKTFGGYLKDSMTKTSCEVAGLEYIKGDKPGEAKCGDDIDIFGTNDDELSNIR